jgi:hypothetical protein
MPLQTGSWKGCLAGRQLQLNITSIDSSGRIQGTINAHTVSGLWDEDAQKLILFLFLDAGSNPAAIVTGYLFTDTVNLTGVSGSVIFTLAGQIEYFVLTDPLSLGVTARNAVFGWYAQLAVD